MHLTAPDSLPLNEYLHAGLWCARHLTGRYSIAESAALGSFIAPADICLDIGAHAGSWTRPLANLVHEGQVFAFEALPHYARVLERVVRLMGLSNVTVLNHAVSDLDANVEVAWRTRHGGRLTGNTHMATPAELGEVDCVTVRAITLDGWLASTPLRAPISFIKIDVEGAELMALRGGRRLLERFRPVLFVEIVTSCCERYAYHPAELFHLFAELGYAAYFFADAGRRPRLAPTDAGTFPGKGDVLFVPSDHPLLHTADIVYPGRLSAKTP